MKTLNPKKSNKYKYRSYDVQHPWCLHSDIYRYIGEGDMYDQNELIVETSDHHELGVFYRAPPR